MDPGEPALLFRAIPLPLRPSARDKRILRAFAAELAHRIAGGRLFTCLITNDRQLRNLNRDFRGHDYSTDVLSFPSDTAEGLGELAISSERAQAQSAEFGHSLLDELRILMLHGVLHLAGFDHETDGGKMKRAERKWRDVFHLPNTLTTRTAGAIRR